MDEDFFRNGNTCDSILIRNGDKKDSYLQSQEFSKSVENISLFRGRVLSISISIENLINYCIEYVLFDEKNETTELFQKLFLKSTTLGFHNKRKIFKELLKSSNKAKGFYDKSIITQIQNCIDIRNELAHGLLFFDSKQKIFFVESYLKDELKIREITNKGIEEISGKFYKCINEINILVWGKDYAIFKIDKKGHGK